MLPQLPVDEALDTTVYGPREDSWLLVNALHTDAGLLTALGVAVCLEVGPGSGLISAALSGILAEQSVLFLGADINAEAARVATATFALNRGQRRHTWECVVSDLCSAFGPRLDGCVNVLLFNPPYVPTDMDEVGSRDLAAAWAGGPQGRVVIDRFLPCVARLLAPGGVCYLVLVLENQPTALATLMAQRYGLRPKVVASTTARNERLFVLRFTKPA